MPDGRRVVARGFLTTATDLLPEGSLVFEGTTEDWMLTPSFPNPPTWNDGGREVIKTNELRTLALAWSLTFRCG